MNELIHFTILDENDNISHIEKCLECPLNGVPELATKLYVQGKFNRTTREFYESASHEVLQVKAMAEIEVLRAKYKATINDLVVDYAQKITFGELDALPEHIKIQREDLRAEYAVKRNSIFESYGLPVLVNESTEMKSPPIKLK